MAAVVDKTADMFYRTIRLQEPTRTENCNKITEHRFHFTCRVPTVTPGCYTPHHSAHSKEEHTSPVWAVLGALFLLSVAFNFMNYSAVITCNSKD
jgi:hypothetical protein